MENIERIADDLYFVKYVHREGSFVGITVVLGRRKIGLVDTGFERTVVDSLFPFIRELGRNLEEIDFVVNTHRDGDHVQGNKVIKEKTKAKIAIHELDAEAVEFVDVTLKDGDYVELGDRKFEVMHTPGHTPGNICLYQKENQLLITGDSLCGDRVDLIRMDKDIYIDSIKRLLSLNVRLLIQSHPRKPFEKAVLVKEEPREMMLSSISLAEKSE
jgi:glyoxylase-like metal-dependent hydrolase (beta-lactamase superfamily II)